VKDNYQKLKKILREMFQMDQADLDFGIYGIMNQKRAEVEQFLDHDLLPQVKEAFQEYSSLDRLKIEEKLSTLKQNLEDAGVNPEDSPKYQELMNELNNSVDMEALEQEVYSHLVSFFSRYYDDGDFLSRPRYKEGVYAIPYKGEEVKLHWANADQYYIKTSEYFKDYTFKISDSKRVHFKIIAAGTEQDNNKEASGKERRFVLYETEPFLVENGELIIQFEYKVDPQKQDKLNEAAAELIEAAAGKKPLSNYMELFAPAPTEANHDRTLLEKHLKEYTARNTFDYFIHKDLGGFLSRELDFYLKNEVFFIDDIDKRDPFFFQQSISKVKVIKKIALKIIAFLAQLEDFQKSLWLKKKFVVETNYCITLDQVPEYLYDEIIANQAQIEEWKRLFAIEEIQPSLGNPGYSEPLTLEFLKSNPYLLLDTAFFSEEFKNNLLASIENIDEQMDGLLIHSENFQALNLLQERYREQIDGVYIDPPYNTDGLEIIYKNGYKDSSWLSLIKDRLMIGKKLLTSLGIYCIMIDDAEYANLYKLMEEILTGYTMRSVIIEYNHRGRVKSNFAYTHEYAIWAIKSGLDLITRKDEVSGDIKRNLRRTGTDSTRISSPSMFYGIEVDKNSLDIVGVTEPLALGETLLESNNPNTVLIYPIDDNGIERRWYYGKDRIMEDVKAGKVWAKLINNNIQIHYHQDGKPKYRKSLWTGPTFDSSTYGSELLNDIFGLGKSAFSFPKSIFSVFECLQSISFDINATFLDYFAGSGTTGHAVINLNRKDNGNRKYILVEMGEYFDTVLKPRIQKIIYSKDWRDGKPVSREGSSHMFKYMRLESYEDTLNNLDLHRNELQKVTLADNAKMREQYLLSYMLEIESQGSPSLLNLDQFEDPFNYKLNVYRNGESQPVNVDMVETFNYLLGLKVQQTEFIRGFKVVRGELLNGEKVLIIWRNLKEKSNEELDNFFTKQDYNTRDFDFDRIYVNGDNNLPNIKTGEERWKVYLIEQEFKRLMFDVSDL
jgi:adenine-specific DNA-methyltransferase